jgi:hypothetical protein
MKKLEANFLRNHAASSIEKARFFLHNFFLLKLYECTVRYEFVKREKVFRI